MKCGICGEDTRKGSYGQPIRLLTTRELVYHKKYDHPKEYEAILRARREKRDATKAAAFSETKRRQAARLAASKPAVARAVGDGLVYTRPSSMIQRYAIAPFNGLSRPRFPDLTAYAQYQEIHAQILELEIKAQEFLVQAWENGALIPLEHLDELDRAEAETP